jgi:transposase-like protein
MTGQAHLNCHMPERVAKSRPAGTLRATNAIEQLNKEFKWRTKPMEIVAGENACYLLLAFISLIKIYTIRLTLPK